MGISRPIQRHTYVHTTSSVTSPFLFSRRRRSSTEINPAILNAADSARAAEQVFIPEQHQDDGGGNGGSANNSSSSMAERQNMDIVLLSRHIDHMQRICR